MEQRVKETLEKQLQLLSERSEGCLPDELAELTNAMATIGSILLAFD